MDEKQYLSNVGKRVRQARERKLYSLLDLAAITNISKRTLLNIEHGKVNTSITRIKTIADVLEVSTDDLLS